MPIAPMRQKWKSAMTDRERFNRQMHYQSVDRCFNMEFGYWDDNFSQWDIFVNNNIKTNNDADVFFAFDNIVSIGGQNFMFPPMVEKVIEERENTRIIMNSEGLWQKFPLKAAAVPFLIILSLQFKTPRTGRG